VVSGGRELRTIILNFIPRNNKPRIMERDQWITDIRARSSRQRRQSPQPAPRGIPGPAEYGNRPGGGDIALTRPPADPVFCNKCGRKAASGSVFCDRCGSRIIYPEYPQEIPHEVVTRDTGNTRADSRKYRDIPLIAVDTGNTGTDQRKYRDIPFVAEDTVRVKDPAGPGRPPAQRQPSRFPGKAKTAMIVGVACVVLVLIIMVTGIAAPLGFPSLLNMTGNASASNTSSIPLAVLPKSVSPVPTETIPEVIPEETVPAGDLNPPEATFDQYFSLFNAGDGAGLYELLSENAKSANSPDSVSASITAIMESGVYIGAYDLISSDIQENSAVLELDITWIKQGEPVIVRETIPFVRENDQWKLENLVVLTQT
ncbi:MAG: hypothetical protein PHT99_10175, partial [Methanoregula sp.]|nr:hypothetical protein [Methanoregula sp.]